MRIPWSFATNTLRAFALDTRASAGIELAIGAVVLVSVAALCFDLYTRVEADTAAARVAATMADYVSRGPDTEGDALDRSALKSLGQFLREHSLGASDAVLVVSALRRDPGTARRAVKVLWSDILHFGRKKVTRKLAPGCSRFVQTSKKGRARPAKPLPGRFTLAAGEVVAVVELCARPGGAAARLAGDIYRHHVLPVREPEKAFPAPAKARA
ncbi:MAG: hypothetical protein F4169_17055 [Gammaproteobacteria bacterium]|nr:hypothetical protein [Gammaproteobacteria bacterium]